MPFSMPYCVSWKLCSNIGSLASAPFLYVLLPIEVCVLALVFPVCLNIFGEYSSFRKYYFIFGILLPALNHIHLAHLLVTPFECFLWQHKTIGASSEACALSACSRSVDLLANNRSFK